MGKVIVDGAIVDNQWQRLRHRRYQRRYVAEKDLARAALDCSAVSRVKARADCDCHQRSVQSRLDRGGGG